MIVTAHIKFSLHTTFLDRMIQVEDNRLPGESIEDGVIRVHKALEAAAERIKKEHESMRGVQETYPQPFPNPNRFDKITDSKESMTIIYQQGSGTELADYLANIQTAVSLDELKSYKLLAANDKTLYNAYNQRLKELTNGK